METDEVQLREAAEIVDGKYAAEHALQALIVALVGQQIHLQEALIGVLLHFDQIRNRNRSFDLGKVNSLAVETV
jgi:hypothetical protein